MKEINKRQRVYAVKQGTLAAPDRLSLCALLVKAGYTVRCGREAVGSGRKKFVYFVEFWEEPEDV